MIDGVRFFFQILISRLERFLSCRSLERRSNSPDIEEVSKNKAIFVQVVLSLMRLIVSFISLK